MDQWVKAQKRFYNFKLYWTLPFSSFCSYWIFAFAYLLGIPIGITTSAIGLKICATTAGIKKCKLIIKKMVLLAKSKLNSTEVLISNGLIGQKR